MEAALWVAYPSSRALRRALVVCGNAFAGALNNRSSCRLAWRNAGWVNLCAIFSSSISASLELERRPLRCSRIHRTVRCRRQRQ